MPLWLVAVLAVPAMMAPMLLHPSAHARDGEIDPNDIPPADESGDPDDQGTVSSDQPCNQIHIVGDAPAGAHIYGIRFEGCAPEEPDPCSNDPDPIPDDPECGEPAAYVSAGGAAGSASCFSDEAGDVVEVETGNEVVEPHADIVKLCVNVKVNKVELSVQLDEGDNPRRDDNWLGSLVGWYLDVDGDGRGEFFAQLSKDADGDVEATVQDRSTAPATETCIAKWRVARDVYTVTISHDCIGGTPGDLGVGAIVIHDEASTDRNGAAVVDVAPDRGLVYAQPRGQTGDHGLI